MIDLMKWIGIPYNENGDNVIDGFNCYTFAKYFRENQFGLKTETRLDGSCSRYKEVTSPVDGDLALISTKRGTFDHIGVYVNDGIIHCNGNSQSGHVIWHPLLLARSVLRYRIKFFRG